LLFGGVETGFPKIFTFGGRFCGRVGYKNFGILLYNNKNFVCRGQKWIVNHNNSS
jgi:hypothetical protein